MPQRNGLRSADGLMLPAVAETLDTLQLGTEDRAAERLARQYAAAIDEAAEVAAEAQRLAEEARDQLDEDAKARLSALRKRVSASVVLAELGPKLAAVLADLGATPGGRAKLGKTQKPGAGGRLEHFRGGRSA